MENEQDDDDDGSGATKKPTLQFNKQDNSYFMKLPNGTKRVSVQKFKGKTYVAIREFYEKDGEERPTKKGVNLTLEQWRKLSSSIQSIDKCLQLLNTE